MGLLLFRKYADDLPQSKQWFVNVNALFGESAFTSGQSSPFGPSQVHEFDPAAVHKGRILLLKAFDPDREDGVAPGRTDIEPVGAVDPVRQANSDVLQELLAVLALIHKQILDCELLVLIPSQTKAVPTVGDLGVETARIEQVVNSLRVYLQIWNWDADHFRRRVLDFTEQGLHHARHDAVPHLGDVVALHREGFARACLPIDQYCAMIALQDFRHEVVDAAAFVDVLLGWLLG